MTTGFQNWQQQIRQQGSQSPYPGGISGSGSGQQGQQGQYGQQGGLATLTYTQTPVQWSQISQPGTYLEVSTGDIYRIPPQAFASPGVLAIHKESTRLMNKFLLLSPDALVSPEETLSLAQQAQAMKLGF